jgi:Zn-dependent M28 family amino/carboxypeptidase
MRKPVSVVAVLAMLVLLVANAAVAAIPVDTEELREAVTVDGVREHQEAFQDIADDNGGVRSATSSGYEASVEYVAEQLLDAGYAVEVQEFEYVFFEVLDSAFEQISPSPEDYEETNEYDVMDFSGGGDVTEIAEGVDLALGDPDSSTSGCESSDFDDFTPGNIALMQRGTCSFFIKASNAEAAGAVAAVVFNQGNTPEREGMFFGTLGGPGVTIPTISTSFTIGSTLDGATLRVFADVVEEMRTDSNVIAETAEGRDDRVVVVGAHLDSVPEGPGINDNGSGSGAILEIALQMAELEIEPRNKVRFAWWGAEELGLVGSTAYVSELSRREVKDIALNLNFDMVGSPNYVRFVYDGDGSATPSAGPVGSGNIEDVFLDYFESMNMETEPTAFDGRSDYGPFIAVGIPAGGLFTGAEGVKTAEEAAIYGGTAGDQYDSCYHLACDTFDNYSEDALDEMSDAAAHAVLTFAMTTSAVSGTNKGSSKAIKSIEDLEFIGSAAQR